MARAGVKSIRSARNVITGNLLRDETSFKQGSIDDDGGKASVIQLQRELKDLKDENATLKHELDNVKSLYQQLVSEGPSEHFGERRVQLLKSQVIQLERQVLLQAEGLSSRSGVLFEIENNLHSIADALRELLASESRGPAVPVQRSQLTTLIETAESGRLRLFKNLESNNREKLEQPLIFMGRFAKPKPHDDRPVSLMDVCSGSMEHLSLKQIAKLESKLFALNQQLHTLHQSLNTAWSPNSHALQLSANQHLPSAVNQRLAGLLTKADRMLVECCQDLASLSVLVPAAPWPLLSKSVVPEISVDQVMAALPSFPRNKHQQVKSVIEATIKASNYARRVSKLEAKACVEELRFHQALYDLQFRYMESLYAAVREAYTMFESSIQETLCTPMKDVMTSFEELKATASEVALRKFLSTFKTHREKLNAAIEGLAETEGNGAEAISSHGQQFLEAVKVLAEQTATERDRLASELAVVKKVRDAHLQEGLDILRSPKAGEDADREAAGAKEVEDRGEGKS